MKMIASVKGHMKQLAIIPQHLHEAFRGWHKGEHHVNMWVDFRKIKGKVEVVMVPPNRGVGYSRKQIQLAEVG